MVAAERRCAIYTRKSSEDGLEQSFNSLDAQYEACAAYIASQRHEGWRLLPQRYDDGGYSGGTLERPALQELLAAVEAGNVDLIVVYKIDRLTRSLMDFARLVERFDRHQVSFVSVTQAFNTTTSMGRLTLNVLLSFAQFEREVTGERIRDKIAASKRKGLWMGGTVPMGYAAKDRQLVVVPEAAAEVVRLFERYRARGSVAALKEELDTAGIVSRIRESRAGRKSGGTPYSRGALYQLLKNRVYRGEIAHKGTWHPGPHEAIVPQDLWDAVQARLAQQRSERKLGNRAKEASLLAGMVVDADGQRLTPSHTVKAGKRYRYYLGRRPGSPRFTQAANPAPSRRRREHVGVPVPSPAIAPRRLCVPAHDLERLVMGEWKAILGSPDLDVQLGIDDPALGRLARQVAQERLEAWDPLTLPEQRRALLHADAEIRISSTYVEVALAPERLVAWLTSAEPMSRRKSDRTKRLLTRRVDANVTRLYGETRILEPEGQAQSEARRPAQHSLLLAIAQGRQWHHQLVSGEVRSIAVLARRSRVSTAQVLHTLRCAWLAPDLVEALLAGRASHELTRAHVRDHFSASWNQQRSRWG